MIKSPNCLIFLLYVVNDLTKCTELPNLPIVCTK